MIQSVRIAVNKNDTHKFAVQTKSEDNWSIARRFKRRKAAEEYIAELYRNTNKEKEVDLTDGKK